MSEGRESGDVYSPSCSVRLSFFSSLSSSSSLLALSRSPKLTPFSFSLSSGLSLSADAATEVSADGPASAQLSPSAGDPDPDRLCAGVANACAPPVAYAENAFTRAGEWCRVGDLLLLPNTGAAGGGDLGRFAADANGDELEAKASKPVRFRPDSREGELGIEVIKDEELRTGVGDEIGLGAMLELAHGDGLVENKLGPLTDAKGEFVEAYAIKPLYFDI